ncbi:hypothetical protein [Aeromicrobium sp. CF3.5]|uniref:hypothetical protein n=1 Tax=Aeromicrobium sp. CF3.5 TaxID=3373078 RepID=UPI003EE48A06
MREADIELTPWPAAFSESFVEGARRLFDDHNHVMIVGPLGSNRGSLAERLAGRSAPVAWGRDAPSVGSTAVRYSTISQLLPTVRAQPEDSTAQVTAEALTAIGQTFGRPTLCVREAELCDQGSNDVLATLAEEGHIRLVSTVTPSAALTHRFARSAERIDIPPLDEATVTQLLAIRFSVRPHPMTVALLMERSQGAYAVLKQFADASFSAGQIRVLAGTLVTDESVLNAEVDERFVATTQRFSPRFPATHVARDLLDLTAVTMHLDHGEATEIFGDQVVSETVSAGVLAVVGEVLQFRSTVEGLSILHELDTARRRELFDTYRARLQRSERLPITALRSARWHVDVGAPLSPDLALLAVRHANPSCRYGLVQSVVDAVPIAERLPELVIEHCHALAEIGAADELLTQLRSIDPATIGDDDLFAYLRWAKRYLPPDEASQLVDTVRAHTAPHDAARGAALELCHVYGEVFQSAGAQIQKALLSLTMSGQLSPTNQALARMTMSATLRHSSRADQAVEMAATAVRDLEAVGPVGSFYMDLVREQQILAHISAADLEGAREALVSYSAPGVAYGNLGRLGAALWSMLAFYSGDIGAALAQAQMCLTRIPAGDPHQMRGWAEAMAAQILTQVGDIDGVYELLEASHQRPSPPHRQPRLTLMICQACVHDAIGEPEEALDLLQAVIDEAREHDLLLCEVDAAVLSVQIGGPMHLKPLLSAVESVDASSGTSAIWKTFAHAVRDNDMHRLVDLAEELDRQDRFLFAAEVAQFTLDIARRASDMTPEQRLRLSQIADPMQHRKVTRSP